MLIQQINFIEESDWSELVQKTYGRVYKFQQQEGCQPRGIVRITIPDINVDVDDEMNDSVPEVVNHSEMGVKFKVWLERNPEQKLDSDDQSPWSLDLWWRRNFYPNIQTVANDLHKKKLIEAGDYVININW